MATTYHVCATKDYVIKSIIRDGAASILEGFAGTDDEALRAVADDPHEYFAVGFCSNRGMDGKCLGHISGEDSP